ncbi:MAG: GGDEF domain-containing protein [Actinomycetota bacterium]|nr:GGDEF domain-containing protein [Actinomycetota bacterium]
MRSTGGHRRHARRPPTDRDQRRPGQILLATLAVAALAAAAVALFRPAQAFWICVPGALFVSARCSSRLGTGLGSAAVLAAASAASLLHNNHQPATNPLFALVVTAVSVAILVRVRERLKHERDVARASARADPLTGVANRRAILERIEYEIARHARTRRSFGVLVLDLDGFKLLNDRFGHLAGDDLLRDVAAALQGAIRDQDTLARMGGDEFCVLAPETSASGARTLTTRATEAVGRVAAGIDALGASAGAALFPADGRSAVALLQAADERLLEAKRRRHSPGRTRRAA